MSSHVNVSAHNLWNLYGTYRRIRVTNPCCSPSTTFQLVIVELLLYILFFSILREEYASFGREQILGLVAELQLPPPRQYFFWSRLLRGTISMMHAT